MMPTLKTKVSKKKKLKVEKDDFVDVFSDEFLSGFMTPPEVTPPEVMSYKDYQDDETKKLESRLVTVPLYLKTSTLHPVDAALFRFLEQARCKDCFRFLCCGEVSVHHENCWSHDLVGKLDENEVMSIEHFRFDVLAGKLHKHGHYIYGFFERLRHVQAEKPFSAARLGLFVRCMLCSKCSKTEFDCKLLCHFH